VILFTQNKYFTSRKFVKRAVARTVRAVVGLILTAVVTAEAQTAPGSRAAGMAGAFVAVADDASAVYWNPAGLAFGPLFNLTVDFGRRTVPADGSTTLGPGSRGSAILAALGMPPVGISYYRLGVTEFGALLPAETGQLDRQEGWRSLRTLATTHVGFTVLQSIGSWLTIGATAKLVRGAAASAIVQDGTLPADELWERASRLETDGHTRGDVDAGAMVAFGTVRLGLVARNLTEPEFADDGGDLVPLGLERAVRVGGAWGPGWPGRTRLALAADADLTRRHEASGDRRDIAAGVESWWRDERLGFRGGLRASTVGEARPVAAAGISVGVRVGLFVDAHAAWGRGDDRGWGLGGRVVF
jgi:hypothetical protein